MKRTGSKIHVRTYDEIFNGGVLTDDRVIEIATDELHTFKNHPFRVLNDVQMMELVDSIRKNGVLVPGICRNHPDGGYEIIAGHRRVFASRMVGNRTIPMLVKELSDDEAVAVMVDSNIQRENLLPSEKARAYRMRFECEKHAGIKGRGNTLENIGKSAGESGKTVQRFIALSYLIPELLDLVDAGKLGIRQGVELSALSDEAQNWVRKVLIDNQVTISIDKALRLKEHFKNGELTLPMVKVILEEEKKKKHKVVFDAKTLGEYFNEDVSISDIEELIFSLLEDWKEKGGVLS